MGSLTDVQIKQWIKAKESVAKADGEGLTFTLSASGRAAWILRYRIAGKAKEKTLSHPWVPCLWMDIEVTPSGFIYCSHITENVEKVVSPKCFRRELSLAHYASKDETVLARDVSPIARSTTSATYLDSRLNKTFQGPGFLARH